MIRDILEEVDAKLGSEETTRLKNALTTDQKETALHIAARYQKRSACRVLVDRFNLGLWDKNADGKIPYQLSDDADVPDHTCEGGTCAEHSATSRYLYERRFPSGDSELRGTYEL